MDIPNALHEIAQAILNSSTGFSTVAITAISAIAGIVGVVIGSRLAYNQTKKAENRQQQRIAYERLIKIMDCATNPYCVEDKVGSLQLLNDNGAKMKLYANPLCFSILGSITPLFAKQALSNEALSDEEQDYFIELQSYLINLMRYDLGMIKLRKFNKITPPSPPLVAGADQKECQNK